jgi:hypothetical protein
VRHLLFANTFFFFFFFFAKKLKKTSGFQKNPETLSWTFEGTNLEWGSHEKYVMGGCLNLFRLIYNTSAKL